MMETVVIVLLAYLIGAVPSGYLIGRIFYGVDLKKTGSGNIGATNAYRTLGMKGVIAVHLGMPEPTTVLLCALFAIIGNDWSIFLKFKSGKGVACGVGAFTYICAPATIASFIVWLIVFRWKKIVSLASIAGAPVVPIVIWVLGEPWEYVAFSLAAALIVVVKHKENIERLLRGEEKPIIQGKKESQ